MKHPALEVPLLDEPRIEHLLRNGVGNSFAAEITALFDTRSKELIRNITREKLETSFVEYKKNLHSLKGISLTMGAKRLAAVCAAMDKLIAEGQLEEVNRLMNELHQLAADSLAAISSRLLH